MEKLQLTQVPVARTGMLIRRPAAEVFEALVDPEQTSQFWFTGGSGRLEQGKKVRWDWAMYEVHVEVTVEALERDRRILIEWPGYSGPTHVELVLEPLRDGTTFVRITESGFTGTGVELVKYVADSTQGFSLMLAGLKAFLEHGVRLNLTGDRYPKGVEQH